MPQVLQPPLITGSTLAAISAPSNHKHQVLWLSFHSHICLKARRSWAGHTGAKSQCGYLQPGSMV